MQRGERRFGTGSVIEKNRGGGLGWGASDAPRLGRGGFLIANAFLVTRAITFSPQHGTELIKRDHKESYNRNIFSCCSHNRMKSEHFSPPCLLRMHLQ